MMAAACPDSWTSVAAGNGQRQTMEILESCDICGSRSIPTIDRRNHICRCADCGCTFDNPRPTLEEIGAFYSQPGKYDLWLSEEPARDLLWRRRLKLVRRFVSGGSLLDVGAGTGQFLSLARTYFDVAGTELSRKAIQVARSKYGVELLEGTLNELTFGPRFDVITLFHVLEHVPSPRTTLERCRSLLRDTGFLFVAVPNDIQGARGVIKRWLSRLGVPRYRHRPTGLRRVTLDGSMDEIHLSHFTRAVLARLFARTDFEVEAFTLDPYYAATGFGLLKAHVYYGLNLLAWRTLAHNLYETTLAVVRPARPNQMSARSHPSAG